MDETTGDAGGGFGAPGPTGPPTPVDRFGNPLPPAAPAGYPVAAPAAAPGYPNAGYAPVGAPGYPNPAYSYPPPGAARTGLPRWAIAAIVVVASIPVLGIMAAVAMPVFLNQRAQAELSATSVTLPASIGTLTKSTSAADTQLAAGAASDYTDGHVRDVVAGIYYGADGARTVVVAGRATKPFGADEVSTGPRDMIAGFLNGTSVPSSGVTTTAAGALGGTMACGQGTGERGYWHACGALNTSSFILVASTSTQATDAQARAVREAVITKH